MAAARPSPDSRSKRRTRDSADAKKSGWLGSLFSRELKIKRVGMQLHVVLEDAHGKNSQSSRSGGRGEALRLAHQALQQLLDQHDDARRMMPHLHHLEKSLAQNGSRSLKTLPLPLMHKALSQLDLIEGSAQDADLMTLRLRVDEAIKRRTPVSVHENAMTNIEVKDASHSQFDEADRVWSGMAPLDEAASSMAPLDEAGSTVAAR